MSVDITERPGFYAVHYLDPQKTRPWLEGPPPAWKAPCGYLIQFREEWAADSELVTCRPCRERAA